MFSMRLELNQLAQFNNRSSENKIETEDIENSQDLLSLICEVMEEKKICKFVVQGFGKSLWPVDISTDLLSILEQLSDFLEFLYDDKCTKGYLDFYEQGIEKRLIFDKMNSNINITCESFPSNSIDKDLNTDWGNNFKEDPIEQKKLENMICKLITTFVSLIHEYFPELADHQFFQQWYKNEYFIPCLNKNK